MDAELEINKYRLRHRIAASVFKEMYVKPRFVSFVPTNEDNDRLAKVTFEKYHYFYSPDYPSKLIDLTPHNFKYDLFNKEDFLQFAREYLFNHARQAEDNSQISDSNQNLILQVLATDSGRKSMLVFLKAVERDSKLGYILDTRGLGNIIMLTESDLENRIIINNSAVKGWRSSTFESNIANFLPNEENVLRLRNQIIYAAHINHLCRLCDHNTIFSLNTDLQALLERLIVADENKFFRKKIKLTTI